MNRPISLGLILLVALTTAPGCAIDKTRRSVTFTMQQDIDTSKERSREIEKDLGRERDRIDAMEDRTANASKRLADSGATLETFLDELTAIRGELSALQFGLKQGARFDEDVNLRLAGIEFQVAHMAQELGVTPATMPMGRAPAPVAPPPKEAGGPVDAPVDVTSGVAGGEVAADPASDPAVDPVDDDPADDDAVAVAIEAPADADDEFITAVALVQQSKWDEAGALLQKYLRKNRDSEHYLEAQFLVGQCLFELQRFKNAITEFQKVIEAEDKVVRKGATALWAPRAMFMQGRAFEELGTKQDLEAAALFFDELVRLYPAAADAERARRRLEVLDANR